MLHQTLQAGCAMLKSDVSYNFSANVGQNKLIFLGTKPQFSLAGAWQQESLVKCNTRFCSGLVSIIFCFVPHLCPIT